VGGGCQGGSEELKEEQEERIRGEKKRR